MLRRNANATVQVNARIKETLRRKLEAAAKEHQVSFNRELTTRLEDSFQREPLDSLLYKIGMVAAAQSGKPPARSLVGSAMADALDAEAKTPASQQEQKRTRKRG
jgi:hypothetical protein